MADKVIKVNKKYQVRFSRKNIKGNENLKIGTVVKFLNSKKKLMGEGKIFKLTKRTGYADIYKGKGKVAKGNTVIVLEEFTGANKIKWVKRKWGAVFGLGLQSLGSITTNYNDDPKNFDSFFGYRAEISYRFNDKYGVFAGIDRFGASKAVDLIEGTDFATSSGNTKVNGEASDMFVAGQYYFQRYPFINSYAALGYIIAARVRANLTVGGTSYEYIYRGSGFMARLGKEWVLKSKWMFAANADLRFYSFSEREDWYASPPLKLSNGSQNGFVLSAMVGRVF